ncbi:hypothetical protein J8281_08235 [Aquimarina sp. U1-2]|nr:hypothetical protein [Aquimarina sp. U1-2]
MKNIVLILIMVTIASGCQQEQKNNPFLISSHKIGHLTSTTQVNQLDSIFAKDSIVKIKMENRSLRGTSDIEIFEKGGAKLLVLEARNESDPSSTIQNIQVIDPRYQTTSGLSAGSSFRDIKDHYKISKINNTLSTAVLFIDSIQAYVTIDKKKLPKKFQSDTDVKIKASDIPDTAKIKNFWIRWDAN